MIFLQHIPTRAEGFKSEMIQNSFAAAGLVPLDPNRVLSKLNIQLCMSTPPGSRPGSQSSAFSPKTPQNIIDLHKQASSIKAFLKQRSKSPPSLTKPALDQLIKGCQLATHSAVLFVKENTELRAMNEIKKQKRARTNGRMTHEGGLSVQEAQQLIQQPFEPIHPVQPPPARPVQPVQPATQPARRRLPTCGKCRDIGHKANACPVR